MIRDLAQYKLRRFTDAGWSFLLECDQEYFDADTNPIWKAKFYNHQSGTTFIAEDADMSRAIEKAMVKLEQWLYAREEEDGDN